VQWPHDREPSHWQPDQAALGTWEEPLRDSASRTPRPPAPHPSIPWHRQRANDSRTDTRCSEKRPQQSALADPDSDQNAPGAEWSPP